MKKEKLKRIANALAGGESATNDAFSRMDRTFAETKMKLKEEINVATLADVNKKLNDFRRAIDLGPIVKAIDALKGTLNEAYAAIGNGVAEDVGSIQDALQRVEKARAEVQETASTLSEKFNALARMRDSDYVSTNKKIGTVQENVDGFTSQLEFLQNFVNTLSTDIGELRNELDTDTDLPKKVEERLTRFKGELVTLLGQGGHGGNANRNIAVGGNASVLSRYTDLNIKAGNNVTLTYSNNNNTKMLDLTIASSGGSGSTRSITSIATSQAAGDTTGTDYVYICNDGILLTLPTAVSNTNLYTVKNNSNSSIMVATTGGQTIDDDTTIIMPVKYTSVDLISDDANWHVT